MTEGAGGGSFVFFSGFKSPGAIFFIRTYSVNSRGPCYMYVCTRSVLSFKSQQAAVVAGNIDSFFVSVFLVLAVTIAAVTHRQFCEGL